MSSDRPSTVGAAVAPEDHRLCRLFASTVHGLEDLAAAELAERGHRVVSVRKRLILLASPPGLRLDRPRTVDDLLVGVAELPDPGHTKADLARLRSRLHAVDLSPVRAALDGGGSEVTVSVSASMSGRRTYNRHDLEDVVGAVLAERLGVGFASRGGGARPPADAVEWRAVLSPEGLLLGVRGRRAPLHRRPWKTASIPGTLHPPVAAAMARLARIEAGTTVIDPCCGAGTILREAREAAPNAELAGSDVNRAALAASADNTGDLPGIALARHDAAHLPYRARTVDRIVTNPAWGRQVTTRRPFPALLAEWRRVLAADGLLVCLAPPELLPHFQTSWNITGVHPLSLSGSHPLIVVAAP